MEFVGLVGLAVSVAVMRAAGLARTVGFPLCAVFDCVAQGVQAKHVSFIGRVPGDGRSGV